MLYRDMVETSANFRLEQLSRVYFQIPGLKIMASRPDGRVQIIGSTLLHSMEMTIPGLAPAL
jgi:hypothetical protein